MSSSPGALLMLLLAVYLLLAYFTGRLEWLFALGRDTAAGYKAGQTPATAPTAIAPGAPGYDPRYRSPGQAYA